MNVLLLDQTACFVAFALRCMREGHHVRVCMAYDKDTGQQPKAGDGLVEKIQREEWQKSMNWADLVLCSDNVKWLKELDAYRKKGYPILAPSYESAQLELDRGKGQALFDKHGIATIAYETFSNFGTAERYVRTRPEDRFVAKPNGDKDKALSYVSKNAADMIYMLRKWDKTQGKGQFMLQDYVEGIEFAVAGWMGPQGFCSYFEENFEHKKLMPDDYGPNTGEMGTCCHYTKDSALAREVLLPLEGDLIKLGHRGSVDVSVMVSKKVKPGTPYPLEFTCRLGWPAFNIVQALHPEACEWMASLVDGEDSFQPLDLTATGVVVAIPPFPYEKVDTKDAVGVPIYGLDHDNPYFEFISPSDAMSGTAPYVEDGRVMDKRLMVSSGPYLAVVTGVGETVKQSSANAYKAVKTLEIPSNPIVRSDVGDISRELNFLQEYGFAESWTYQ